MKLGTSYFGNRILRHVKADMEQLRRQNFNLVVHTYNENDHLFYRKTMGEIVRMTKSIGHKVYIDPWGVGKVFGGESFSNFVMTNLDCLQVLSDGKPAGMACPMNATFRKFMQEWIDAALETGADYLFWDEPHFYLPTWIGGRPNTWGCCCDTCKGLFHDKYGHDMPATITPEVKEYREWGIRDFLAELIKSTRQKGGKNALCLLPHDEGEEGAVDNWEYFASMEGLDVFGTDPYFQFFNKGVEWVDKFSKKVVKVCAEHGLESQLWFQGFRIPAGTEGEQAKAVQVAVDAGVRNLAVWGFEACEHISWIRPDNPQALWLTFVNKFGQLKRDYPDEFETQTVKLPRVNEL